MSAQEHANASAAAAASFKSASRTFPEISQVLRADDGKPEVSSPRLNSDSSVLSGLEGPWLEKKSSKIVL